jgi:hypothetical protein
MKRGKTLNSFLVFKYRLRSTINNKPTSFDKDEILANHRSFMTSLNIPSGKESEDLSYLYWIPKLYKTPYKERYIAGSCGRVVYRVEKSKVLMEDT